MCGYFAGQKSGKWPKKRGDHIYAMTVKREFHCIKAVSRIYCKLMTGPQTCQLLPRKASWGLNVIPCTVSKRERAGVAPERANSPLTHTPKEIPIIFFFIYNTEFLWEMKMHRFYSDDIGQLKDLLFVDPN